MGTARLLFRCCNGLLLPRTNPINTIGKNNQVHDGALVVVGIGKDGGSCGVGGGGG